jgi:pimeloyl-ACP methyl ester carboxylesterase
MSDDLLEILDSESIQYVISIGHDWGSFLAQRFYLWHSSRVKGLGLVSVAYLPPDPSQPFNLDGINQMTEQHLGYPQFAYWGLFTAPDGPQIMRDHVESFYGVLYGNPSTDWMKQMFCAYGAMRSFILSDKTVSLHPYAQDPAFRDAFVSRYRRDGFEAPVQWYISLKDGVQFEVEKDIKPEVLKVELPVLFIGCTGDPVCLTSSINPARDAGLLPDLTVKLLECGHWCPYEKPKEVGESIAEFLKEKGFL